MITEYSLLIIVYIVSLVLVTLAGVLRMYSFAAALLGGAATVFWILCALVCRISPDRILVLVLAELLVCCIVFRKGESL